MRVLKVNLTNKELMYSPEGLEDNFGAAIYGFSGWEPGWLPTETFDNRDYTGCLHGVSLSLMLIGDPRRSQMAIEDNGIIHELIHALHISDNKDTYFYYSQNPFGAPCGLKKYEHSVDRVPVLNRIGQQIRNALEVLQHDATEAYKRRLEEPRQEYQPNPVFAPRQIQKPTEDEKELQGERFFAIRPFNQVFYSSKPLHQQVLQRAGEKEASHPASNGEAERPDDLRAGESRQVPLHTMRQTGEI